MPDIIDALERFGPLDWYAVRPAELRTGGRPDSLFPPIITFRFTDRDAGRLERLQRTVGKYQGTVSWIMDGMTEKNQSLLPQRIRECKEQHGLGSTMDAVRFLIENDPPFVRAAFEDFESLVSFIQASA